MKYIFAFLLAALFALPSFAQGVDNCCQIGRACGTDEDWDKGYYDYVNGMCGAGMTSDMSMMPLERDGYTFVGSGPGKSQVIRLTSGKWSWTQNYSRFAWTRIHQVHETGENHSGGKCLSWPRSWSWYGWSGSWLAIAGPWYREIVVRTNCLVRLEFFWDAGFNPEFQTYKVFLKKIDGNF